MFQIIGGKRAAIRSAGRGRGRDRQLLLDSRLSSIAVAFGCLGIVELSLWIGPLARTAAVEE
jgi:hypothetical protein